MTEQVVDTTGLGTAINRGDPSENIPPEGEEGQRVVRRMAVGGSDTEQAPYATASSRIGREIETRPTRRRRDGSLEFAGVRIQPLPRRITRSEPSTLKVLARWDGEVVNVGDGDFTAVVTPLRGGHVVERAVIPKDEVAPGDLELLTAGARFIWAIGYETDRGTRRRVSIIRFRRFPVRSTSDMHAARERAERLEAQIQPLPSASPAE